MNFVKLAISILAVSVVVSASAEWGQVELEDILCNDCDPIDFFPEGDPPYVSYRYRNSLPEFQGFISMSGWTTNQFIEGLICAITNNVKDSNWSDEQKRRTAGRAAWKLGEIDDPAVTNFFRWFNDEDNTPKLKVDTIPPMFWRTNLEPDVIAYMRTLCMRTNIYSNVEHIVMGDMFETLSTMPDALKPSATNRVARYMYFAIHHVTNSQGWQDRELANFIPAYSNSIQRLQLMQYVANSATNTWERSNAVAVVQELSAIPTNQLNDISWIAEDLNGN